MFKAEYIGSISHLIGETALCRLVEGEVLAQFDNRELETWQIKEVVCFDSDRQAPYVEYVDKPIRWWKGWHKFDKDDFVRIWDESQ